MKRNAGSELNHDNWDKEEEKEERGSFLTADKNIISQRKVIVARRKPTASASGVFKSFTGFSENSNATFSLNSSIKSNDTDSNKEKHLNSLKTLNKKFLEAISKHINDNEICVLTPLLDDYSKHLSIIKSKYPLSTSFGKEDKSEVKIPETPSTSIAIVSAPVSNTTSTFSFNTSEPFKFGNTQKDEIKSFPSMTSTPEVCKQNTFGNDMIKPSLFGGSSLFSTNEKTNNNFILPTSNKTEGLAGFSFGTNTNQSNSLFGNGASTLFSAQDNTAKTEEEEEYVPPVAEVREVKEKDSVYDTKCKLYYQKDNEWKSKGVGNLFLKPLAKGKVQLIIRADNSLATIILNVLVNEKTPLSTNQNNVSLVTVTDFVKEAKPTPLLIRVKTPEKAEELLAEMKKQL